jgi:hypothetical protein
VVHSDPEDSSPLSEAVDTPKKDTDVSGTEVSPVKEEAKKEAKKEEADDSDTSVLDESPKKAKAKAADKIDKQDDDGSDTSVVYDEPPKRKGKANESEAAPKKRKSQGPKETASDQTPDDALIKQLQSQLLKCGVRKIWAFELKKYGDDKKAKIRHLKGMLSDVGMKGRFSESRAREIKELRELQADLEAVMEGEKSWGVSGRPARRRAAKGFKEPSDDEDSDEGQRRRLRMPRMTAATTMSLSRTSNLRFMEGQQNEGRIWRFLAMRASRTRCAVAMILMGRIAGSGGCRAWRFGRLLHGWDTDTLGFGW